jgi:glycosyltransferase involved in cell wall biosynthesis
MKPRLSIVIPTHDRSHLIPRAIDSALAQTVPVKIIVSDDGTPEESAKTTAVLNEKYELALSTGHIEHIKTHGHGAWENWKAGIEYACGQGAEFVAWLQDDDVILSHYASRVIRAFDIHSRANVWEGRCQISEDGNLFYWYKGNGPFVFMEQGEAGSFGEGSILAFTSYFTSNSLAPGFAFRNAPRFREALDLVPPNCDIFVERLVPALAANGGPWIADPYVAGFWIQHPDQLSTKQHPDQPRQTGLLVDALDALMPSMTKWEETLAMWCLHQPADLVIGWLGQLDMTERESKRKSPFIPVIRRIMMESLKGRIEMGRQLNWFGRLIVRLFGRKRPVADAPAAAPTTEEVVIQEPVPCS